jgi:hypothetical protein
MDYGTYSSFVHGFNPRDLFLTAEQDLDIYIKTSEFWPRVRARALRAPVFLSSLTHKTGRCAPPPLHRSFAASYSTPKNIYNLSDLGRLRQGLFSFHKGCET